MIKVFTCGRLKDPNLKGLIQDYMTRLERFTRLDVVEVSDQKSLIRRLRDDDFLILLDEDGGSMSSLEFSDFIRRNYLGKNLTFIVGGPEGLDEEIVKRADRRFSLSKLTFTSQMSLMLLVEQVYRAFTIIKGVKYHK
jgi:23S rRNA (pseudouridine1915-N3)-methyltransferase